MTSYWEKDTIFSKADFLIVGAGITGMNAGIRLKSLEPRAEVVVVDRGCRGDGASYRNAGFACLGSPTELLADMDLHGEEHAWETVKMRWDGLNALIARIGESAMDLIWCGGQEIFPMEDEAVLESALDRLHSMNMQFRDITGVDRHFAPVFSGTYKDVAGVIGIHAEGRLHPGRMMTALDTLARQLGVRVLGGVDIERIVERQNDVELITRRGLSLISENVGLATNGFTHHLNPTLPVRPARNQVYLTGPVALGTWDVCMHCHQGYIYCRKVGDRLLIGGGRHLDPVDESTDEEGVSETISSYLQEFVQRHFGISCSFQDAWSGTLGLGDEKRPYIQQFGPRLFAGVRLGGMGVAIGTLVGDSLAHRMLGR